MDFHDVVSTAWTNRYYLADPVDDDVLEQAVDAARCAPRAATANRRTSSSCAITDEGEAARLVPRAMEGVPPRGRGEQHRDRWGDRRSAGVPPQGRRIRRAPRPDPGARRGVRRVGRVAPTDLDTGRLSIVGGGSVYPAVQNFLLGLRNAGLGGALTTLLCHYEAEVKELLGIPEGYITAATIAIGWPGKGFPKRLNRRPIRECYSLERFGNPRS